MENTYSLFTFIKTMVLAISAPLIYLRITVNGKRDKISVKRSVDPSRWDSQANRMKGNKEEAKEINSLIDSTSLKLHRIYKRLLETDEAITARKIKKIFLGHDVSKKSLMDAFLAAI